MDLEEIVKAEVMALRACIFALLQEHGSPGARARIRSRADEVLASAFAPGSEQAEFAAEALQEIFEGFGPHL